MNAKRLALLAAVAVLALGVAVVLRTAQDRPAASAQRDQPLLPALRDHVNDVSAITLTGAGDKVIATLTRGKDGWAVAERSGYPADMTAIRGLLVKLGRATLVEPKTSNAQRYPDIGVDDVTGKDAKGVLVEIAGPSAPIRLIVGNYSARARGTFVRRDGEAQSWLASGDLSVPKAVTDWEKRDVVDVAADRVAAVTLTAPGGKAVKLSREHPGDAFTVVDAPAGRKVDQGMASTVAATLSGLRIDDAFPARDVPAPEPSHRAAYVTFDGVTVTAVAWTQDGKDYVQFRAALDRAAAQKHMADHANAAPAPDGASQATGAVQSAPREAPPAETGAASASTEGPQADLDALAAEVATLDRSLSEWTYVLPAYLYGAMTKTLDDVLVPVKTGKAAPTQESHSH